MVLNNVTIWGRLTADPALQETSGGKKTVRVNVAVPQKKYSRDAEAKTDFITVQAWNNQAEFLSRYFAKGSAVLVQGTLRNNNYTDKNGVKRYETYVLANEIQFGENKPAASSPAAMGEHAQSFHSLDTSGYEEIPSGELY